MLTRSAKNFMACIPLSSGAIGTMLQVTDVYGTPRFAATNIGNSYYPVSKTETFTNSATLVGISIGTDGTAATENDYNLGATITSGVSATVDKSVTFISNVPTLKYLLTVTNTGAEAITVREVGFKQNLITYVIPGYNPASNAPYGAVVLIDRTVLNEPVTIQPSDAAIIEYYVSAQPFVKTVSGIECASFLTATDAQVAAMIDAARQGTINLQTDCGWAVGDVRTIHVDAWTGGNSTAHAAQDIDIVITSFDDYNNCGCLFQFDFFEAFATLQRMNSSNTNVGGYGQSEMCVTTLPALVNALPEWLRTRLKTFDVLASAGNTSTTIETVSGNKLALRSEIEVSGTTTYSPSGEGEANGYYLRSSDNRKKRQGRTGSANTWWLRSPWISTNANFCTCANSGSVSIATASLAYGLSPFGCI